MREIRFCLVDITIPCQHNPTLLRTRGEKGRGGVRGSARLAMLHQPKSS